MRKIFFLAFLLLGVRLVAAPGGTLCAAGDWSMRRVSSADGLPSNKVNDIAQDSLGFVWMATGNGLCRYDGFLAAAMQDVSCDSSVYIEPNMAQVAIDDANGLVWGRTSANVIVCFDRQLGRFVDYTGRGDCLRPYGKVAVAGGAAWLYGAGSGVRRVVREGGRLVCTDYRTELGNLPDKSILDVCADGSGNVWLLTRRGVVAVASGGGSATHLRGRRLVACAGYGGGLLVVGADGTVYAFDGSRRLVRKLRVGGFRGVAGGDCRACFVWGGRLLMVYGDKTVAVDPRTGNLDTPEGLQLGGPVECREVGGGAWMLSDGRGDVLLLCPGGVDHRLSLASVAGPAAEWGLKVRGAMSGGLLYIATNGGGLFVYRVADGRLLAHIAADRNRTSISNVLLAVMAARDGTVWVGNEAVGATCLWRERRAATAYMLPAPQGGSELDNAIQLVAPAGRGLVAVATRSNGLYWLDPASGAFTQAGRTRACAYAYLVDRDGHTWVGTRGDGLYVDGVRHCKDGGEGSLSSDHIFDIAQDGRGRVWIATWDGGLLVARRDSSGKLYFVRMLDRSADERRVRRICIDRGGLMWVATCAGLYVADTRRGDIGTASFARFSATDGNFPITNIICLAALRDGTLCVGGLGCGLILARRNPADGALETTAVTTARGLANNNVRSVAEDSFGSVWVGTEEGISRVNPRNAVATSYRFGPTPLADVFAEGVAMAAPGGTLLFGTLGGVLAVRPAAPARSVAAGAVPRITDVFVDGLPAGGLGGVAQLLGSRSQGGMGIELPHDRNSIDICFSNMDYANAASSFFMYRLEGFDSHWRTATSAPQASYPNLPPGRYTFRVRSMTADSPWSGDAVLSLTVLRPWWARWWAWLIYAAVAVALATYLYLLWLRGFKLRQQIEGERKMGEFRIGLFTSIAHEFRTPLALIQGAADRLLASGSQPVPRGAVQTLRRGVGRLRRQVDMLLEFRRASTGNLRLAVGEADMVKFVRDIVHDFRVAARQKGLALTFLPAAGELVVPFDSRMVEAMVYNLLSNAVKYTPDGGSVAVRLRLDGEWVRLSVEDTGPGLDDRQRAMLFHPFMHGYVSAGGMGIGLYTAHSMAVAHKGRLGYERAVGGGSLFTLELPADKGVYSESEFGKAPSAPPGAGGGEPAEDIREMLPRPLNDVVVAIVEDDADMSAQIQAELGVYFATRCHATGRAALDSVAAEGARLVVCDVMLPDIDGYEVVRRLRQDEATRGVPVIMLTALDGAAHRIRAYKAGADGCVAKPCDFALLAAMAARLIGRGASGGAAEEQSGSDAAPVGGGQGAALVMSKADRAFIDGARAVVERRMADPDFTVDALAAALGMGHTALYAKMKALLGTTPNKFLMGERMRMAAEMLREGGMTAAEVCYKVGIANRSYFFKCFKEHYGVTPQQWRKAAG